MTVNPTATPSNTVDPDGKGQNMPNQKNPFYITDADLVEVAPIRDDFREAYTRQVAKGKGGSYEELVELIATDEQVAKNHEEALSRFWQTRVNKELARRNLADDDAKKKVAVAVAKQKADAVAKVARLEALKKQLEEDAAAAVLTPVQIKREKVKEWKETWKGFQNPDAEKVAELQEKYPGKIPALAFESFDVARALSLHIMLEGKRQRPVFEAANAKAKEDRTEEDLLVIRRWGELGVLRAGVNRALKDAYGYVHVPAIRKAKRLMGEMYEIPRVGEAAFEAANDTLWKGEFAGLFGAKSIGRYRAMLKKRGEAKATE